MQTVMYEFEDFARIMLAFSTRMEFSRESLSVMFDKENTTRPDDKSVSLEQVTSLLFKFELMPL